VTRSSNVTIQRQQSGDPGGLSPVQELIREHERRRRGRQSWEAFLEELRPFLQADDLDAEEKQRAVEVVEATTNENKVRFAWGSAWTDNLEEALGSTYEQVWEELFEAAWVAEDTELMYELVDRRYDVDLTFDEESPMADFVDDEKWGEGWTELGREELLRAFIVFEILPDRHVEQVGGIAADTADYEGRGVGGTARDAGPGDTDHDKKQLIKLAYDRSEIDQRDEDGMFEFDRTLAHEIAHNIDKEERYSEDPDFLKISGWKKYEDGDGLYDDLLSDITVEPPDEVRFFSEKERAAAEQAMEAVVDMPSENEDDLVEKIGEAYDDRGLDHGGTPGILGLGGTHRSKERLAQVLANTTLLDHFYVTGRPAPDEADRIDPWYIEPFDYLENNQYHEGYDWGSWWQYANEARQGETIRAYQFRNPGEEFAEVYTEYHNSGGETVPDEFAAWFERRGLHEEGVGLLLDM